MENRFDELAKLVGGTLPRREALKRIAGVLGGGLLASLGLTSNANALTPAQLKQRVCISFCRPFQRIAVQWRCCMAFCLPSNCEPGMALCGRNACQGLFCTNLMSDPNNCGACGHVCNDVGCFGGICGGGEARIR